MTLNIPYVGPGADNGSTTFADRVSALVGTPAGSSPPPTLPPLKPASIMSTGVDLTNYSGQHIVQLYSTISAPGTVSIYNFSDEACFPVPSPATSTPQSVPANTVLFDLLTYANGPDSPNTIVGSVFPATADVATAAPLTYMKSADGINVGILFSDNNAGAVAECVNLNTLGASATTPPYPVGISPHIPTSFVWAIAIDVPAVISTGDASLFSIGSALDATLQVAFVVKDGAFGAYVNGPNFVSLGAAPAASSKSTLVVHYEVDAVNPLNFVVRGWVNGSLLVTKSFPYKVNETPWSGFITLGTGLHPLAPTGTPVAIGFGPQPAFGGQWAFLALGYYAEDLSNQTLRTAEDIVADLQTVFRTTHIV